MKKLFTIFFCLIVISVNAQINVDSVISKSSITLNSGVKDSLPKDTINISSIVQQQILAAKLKMEREALNNNQRDSKEIVTTAANKNIIPKKTITQLFLELSFEAKVLIIFSTFLFAFIGIRRTVLKIQKKEKIELKKKIGMLREEKVPSKIDDKKSKSRRELIHNLSVKKLSEKNISKKAKELKISKGELLLAARLKYLEYEKM